MKTLNTVKFSKILAENNIHPELIFNLEVSDNVSDIEQYVAPYVKTFKSEVNKLIGRNRELYNKLVVKFMSQWIVKDSIPLLERNNDEQLKKYGEIFAKNALYVHQKHLGKLEDLLILDDIQLDLIFGWTLTKVIDDKEFSLTSPLVESIIEELCRKLPVKFISLSLVESLLKVNLEKDSTVEDKKLRLTDGIHLINKIPFDTFFCERYTDVYGINDQQMARLVVMRDLVANTLSNFSNNLNITEFTISHLIIIDSILDEIFDDKDYRHYMTISSAYSRIALRKVRSKFEEKLTTNMIKSGNWKVII